MCNRDAWTKFCTKVLCSSSSTSGPVVQSIKISNCSANMAHLTSRYTLLLHQSHWHNSSVSRLYNKMYCYGLLAYIIIICTADWHPATTPQWCSIPFKCQKPSSSWVRLKIFLFWSLPSAVWSIYWAQVPLVQHYNP